MSGGQGPDVFEFMLGDGTDRIEDFGPGNDLIRLTGGLDFGVVAFATEAEGLRVQYSLADSVLLTSVNLTHLDVGNFEFV